ncbi:MAG: hypothetical protein KAS23_10750 [Anaerohalosphaera sp.]|nr:hypothetical protein [Anaerohalosphaera sp.]
MVELKKQDSFAGWPKLIFWAGMLVCTLYACTHMVAAGDTWVALGCGKHFVNHGVDTVEPFSANSHPPGPSEETMQKYPAWSRGIIKKIHPTGWINQNWGTHSLFYWLSTTFGSDGEYNYNTMVYWKFVVNIITAFCVYYFARLIGVSSPGAAFSVAMAMVIARSFIDIRPAVHANMLVAMTLMVLSLATYRNIKFIWLTVPITVVWANLHGGYIYVFFYLTLFTGLNLLTCLSKDKFTSIGLKGIYHTIGAGTVAFFAMVIFNPFHLTNLTHTFEISVSKHAESWRKVNEWHSAFEWANPVGVSFPFLVMFVITVLAVFLWLAARFFKPVTPGSPMRIIKVSQNRFSALSPLYGSFAAILTCTAVYIICSAIDLSALNIIIAMTFIGVIMLSIFLNIHLIYLAGVLALVAMLSTNEKTLHLGRYIYYSGRYIYPFLLIPTFVLLHLFGSMFSKGPKYKRINIAFVAATAVTTLLIMLIWFNPFKSVIDTDLGEKVTFARNLVNLPSLQRAWFPSFEFQGRSGNPFNYPNYFKYLYLLNGLSILAYLLYPNLKKLIACQADQNDEQPAEYNWPKIDIAMIAIVAFTFGMAIKMRRFIPLAAFAGCPVVALFFEQAVSMVRARKCFNRTNKLALPPICPNLRTAVILVAGIATVTCGSIWAAKYKRVYLDPWPDDDVRDSVFMRMTASHLKPIDACQFIRDNNISGNMFNYWTEGGAIAFGQTPDEKTGKTPLQLFMDGRAQAAYDHSTYLLWQQLYAGGSQLAYNARYNNRMATPEEFKQIAEELDTELNRRGIWVLMAPNSEFDPPRHDKWGKADYLPLALPRHPDWKLAYKDQYQQIQIDVGTEKGRELYTNIMNEKAIFPNEFSKYFTLADNYLTAVDTKTSMKGLDFAKKAFEIDPSLESMKQLIYKAATRTMPRQQIANLPLKEQQRILNDFKHINDGANEFIEAYVKNFVANKETYVGTKGYMKKLLAAYAAAGHLANMYNVSDKDLFEYYSKLRNECIAERNRIGDYSRW